MDDRFKRDLLAALTDPQVRTSVLQVTLQAMSSETIEVPYVVLPGGRAPQRMSHGAVGFDLYARAVVSTHGMDPDEPRLRATVFDFQNEPSDPSKLSYVRHAGTQLQWVIPPGQSCLVGVGVAFALPYELFQWTAPRSGLAAKLRITLGNAPGTIDSDYRGEAGLIVVNEGSDPFVLTHNMRIGQILFQPVLIPKLVKVSSLDELGETERGAGGFGSTGLRDRDIGSTTPQIEP